MNSSHSSHALRSGLLVLLCATLAACMTVHRPGSDPDIEEIRKSLSKDTALAIVKECVGKKSRLVLSGYGLLGYEVWTESITPEGIKYLAPGPAGTMISRLLLFDAILYIHFSPHTGIFWYWGGSVFTSEYYPLDGPPMDGSRPKENMAPYGHEFYFDSEVDRFIAALEVLCPNLKGPPAS